MDRLDAMQAFVAVADLKGFAPAARKLAAVAVGRDPADRGAGGASRRAAAAADHAQGRADRCRRALSGAGAAHSRPMSRKPKSAAEGERTRPSGRLVVSAPVGFGRLHVSPVMSAYLKRYPEVSGELRLADRIVNLVEDGVDVAVRIGHLADSTLVARQVGEMRRIVVASPAYLKRRGEPKTPAGDRLARDHPVRRHGGRRRTGASSRTAASCAWRIRRASSPTAPTPRSSMPRRAAA